MSHFVAISLVIVKLCGELALMVNIGHKFLVVKIGVWCDRLTTNEGGVFTGTVVGSANGRRIAFVRVSDGG